MLLPRLSDGYALWLPRVSAICALLVIFVGVAAIVASAGNDRRRLAADDVRFISARLVNLDQRVRAELVRLGPQSTLVLAPARAQTRDALAQINALSRFVGDAGGQGAARARLAMRAERRFLAGVESVLAARGGRILHRLSQLDVAAQQQLAGLTGQRAPFGDGVATLQRRWGSRSATPGTQWMSNELRHSLTTPGRVVRDSLRVRRSFPGSAATVARTARPSPQPRSLGPIAIPTQDLQVLRR